MNKQINSRSKKQLQTDENNFKAANNGYYQEAAYEQEIQEVRQENSKLKKQLKEVQAKRNISIKECAELAKKVQKLEKQLQINSRKFKESLEKTNGENYKVQELHFLNKELNQQIESLRMENEKLLEKLKYSSNVLEKKYSDLQRNTFKKIESAMKRIKKSITYLSTLSPKEIQKTKEIMIENLEKSLQLLKGKYIDEAYEEQVNQLMNPLTTLKEELNKKDKEVKALRERLERAKQEYYTQQRINKQILPQYKEAIEKLKKSLSTIRLQASQLENQKMEIKRTLEEKIKTLQQKNSEMMNKFTKLKLEKKIYETKLEEIEGEAEEQKERLIQENQMLKRLRKPDDSNLQSSKEEDISKEFFEYKQQYYPERINTRKQEHRIMHKQASKGSLYDYKKSMSRQKSKSKSKQKHGDLSYESRRDQSQISSHLVSDKSEIKQQIDKIDQEIMQIQKRLTDQLDGYHESY